MNTDVFFAAAPAHPAFLSHSLEGDKTVRNLFFSGEVNPTISTGSGGVLYSDGAYLEVLAGSQRFTSPPIIYHRQCGTENLDLVFSEAG